MKKRIAFIIGLVLILSGVWVMGNSYDFRESNIEIQTNQSLLQARLIKPKNVKSGLDVIVVVHGDGPQDASADGGYKPMWEVMTKEGYAVVSWDKQGVNGSEGNWLKQSMNDRANEVVDVIKWIKEQDDFKSSKIGLWGSSQAGWVIPEVVGMIEVDFTVLVAPAINWIDQGEYHLRQSLSEESSDLIEEQVFAFRDSIVELDRNISYTEYLNQNLDEHAMSEDRFNFVKMNYRSDVRVFLENFESPLLLILGGKDVHVDTRESLDVYQTYIDPDILRSVFIEDTDHFMMKEKYINKQTLLTLTYIMSPKKIMHEAYMDALRDFLSELKNK